MNSRRQFLRKAVVAPSLLTPTLDILSGRIGSYLANAIPPAPLNDFPRLTFYGATRQVSGSCHLLETSNGLYLVDCGSFIADVEDPETENQEFPFEPKEVKALLLTHAHADHIGRLPLLYKRGFRGTIYCTDATRDITRLAFSSGPDLEDDEDRLFDPVDVAGMLGQLKAVPYNKKVDAEQLTVRYTEAGHMLGSAMIEVWADGRKILFGGDMGPDNAPILISPAQHYGADAVLLESTYGPTPKTEISYEVFGKQIQEVIDRGGDVLIPTFAIHKSQLLIFTIQRLKDEGILSKDIPIYCDSSTVHRGNLIYDSYPDYHDDQAKEFVKKHGTLFYFGKYREGRVRDYINAHGKTPSIYISTSGMMAFAASPRHLLEMAKDSKNAVFIPGYQAPDTVGRQLLDGKTSVRLLIEDGNSREVGTRIDLQVERVSGFSSHATGQQLLEWVSKFDQVGPVYVVHGDEKSSTGIAEHLIKMGVAGLAPKRNDTFTVKGERVKPGAAPKLVDKGQPAPPAAVDQ
jgi:metallo-beta-lactamase family protein